MYADDQDFFSKSKNEETFIEETCFDIVRWI